MEYNFLFNIVLTRNQFDVLLFFLQGGFVQFMQIMNDLPAMHSHGFSADPLLSRDVMEPKLWARQFFAGANTLAGEPFSVHPGFLPEFRH